MYGPPSARSASAAPSLPKPAALVPAGTGRSIAASSSVVGVRADAALAAPCLVMPSVPLRSTSLYISQVRPATCQGGVSPALAQLGEHLQPGVTVRRYEAGFALERADREH